MNFLPCCPSCDKPLVVFMGVSLACYRFPFCTIMGCIFLNTSSMPCQLCARQTSPILRLLRDTEQPCDHATAGWVLKVLLRSEWIGGLAVEQKEEYEFKLGWTGKNKLHPCAFRLRDLFAWSCDIESPPIRPVVLVQAFVLHADKGKNTRAPCIHLGYWNY